jgi:hypothetical protein
LQDHIPFLQTGRCGIGVLVNVGDNRALYAGGYSQLLPHILIQIVHGHAVERVSF